MSAFRLTVVGCSGSFPGPDSAASCYLLETPFENGMYRLVLDLGSGALGSLQRHLDLRSVDAVALSHLHADHCLDVCGFYVVRKYHPSGHLGRIPVYGPEGTGPRLARAYDLDTAVGMTNEFSFETYPAEPFNIGPFDVKVARVDHPVPTYALRVGAAGRTLVYSGDTGPCSELDELAEGCDLLLAEASFLEGVDNPQHLHLTGADAGRVADKAAVRRLVLTHIPPWHDPAAVLAEASDQFAGDIEVAVAGAVFEV